MNALVKVAPGVGNIELREVQTPTPGKDEVLIKVQNAAVCATDIHLYYDCFTNSPPFILGHEFSGVIQEVGDNVRSLAPGDCVVSENNPFACGKCRVCTLGYQNLCPKKKAMGIHSDGCFAEYVKLSANLIHKLPGNVTLEEATLSEPLAVAVHAVAHRCMIDQGDVVVVFGAGAIGLLSAQVAKAEGAKKVLLAGISPDESIRFPCAKDLGIETLNIEKEDLFRRVMDLTYNEGADVTVEASGSVSAIHDAIKIIRRAGRMTVSGITGTNNVPIAWDTLTCKGITVSFSYSSLSADWDKGLNLLSEKKVQTAPLITHRFKLKEWKKAFDLLDKLETIRPIFVIGGV